MTGLDDTRAVPSGFEVLMSEGLMLDGSSILRRCVAGMLLRFLVALLWWHRSKCCLRRPAEVENHLTQVSTEQSML